MKQGADEASRQAETTGPVYVMLAAMRPAASLARPSPRLAAKRSSEKRAHRGGAACGAAARRLSFGIRTLSIVVKSSVAPNGLLSRGRLHFPKPIISAG